MRCRAKVGVGHKQQSLTPHYCDARLAYHAGLVLRAHGASLDAGLNLQTAQTYLGGGIGIDGPAFMPVLTFSPRAMVWLCCRGIIPALTLVLTFSPRATVWLCCKFIPPALTFVLIFILVFSFLEILSLIAASTATLLVKWAESRWILLSNIFSAHGVPFGAESVMAGRCAVALRAELEETCAPIARQPG